MKHELQAYNINKMPGWTIPWNSPCVSSRMLMRAIIVADCKCGWPVKWGGKWDIPFPDERMVPTGQSKLYNLTYKEWIDWIRKNEKS